jgi:hypothetical protein
VWTTAELRYLRDHFLEVKDTDLAVYFGTTASSVQAFRLRHGLKRPPFLPPTEQRDRMSEAKRAYDESRKGKPYLKTFRWKDGRTRQAWYVVHRHPDGRAQDMTLAKHVWLQAGRTVPPGLFVVQVRGDRSAPVVGDLDLMNRKQLGVEGSRHIRKDRSEARQKAMVTMATKRKVRAYVEHRPYEFQQIVGR